MSGTEIIEEAAAPQTDYPAEFSTAVERTLGHEGGYTNASGDAGGETNFGISRRQYPDLDIQGLTRAAAQAIYYRDWWQRYGYGALAQAINGKLFDLAVNMGQEAAARCLQRALRACGRELPEDGELGPATRAAAAAVNGASLLAALRAEAAGHYRLVAARERPADVENSKFLNGWLRRAYE